MSVKELLTIVSRGLRKPLKMENIMGDEISVSHLKRIDKVFNKGFHFYLDPKSLPESPESSIFFRKRKFDTELNLASKKIVNQFEEFKLSLSGIAKLADLRMDRALPVFRVSNSSQEVAFKVRQQLYPQFKSDRKDFLRSLIGQLAHANILVFEFVETWNKKEKVNIDGFFLEPNVIVLKRQQISFRREIFTLAHELGHYLLNEEDVENLGVDRLASKNLNQIERWCNDFAYHFLIGDYHQKIEEIVKANEKNDYEADLIEFVSSKTHLSRIALYTRLLFQGKISQENYLKIIRDFENSQNLRLAAERKQRELDKKMGKPMGGSTPRPINSPLLITTIRAAFNEGLISEYDACRALNIKSERLASYFE